jgi:hypothetical protein
VQFDQLEVQGYFRQELGCTRTDAGSVPGPHFRLGLNSVRGRCCGRRSRILATGLETLRLGSR